jgi:hypothetical protein
VLAVSVVILFAYCRLDAGPSGVAGMMTSSGGGGGAVGRPYPSLSPDANKFLARPSDYLFSERPEPKRMRF